MNTKLLQKFPDFVICVWEWCFRHGDQLPAAGWALGAYAFAFDATAPKVGRRHTETSEVGVDNRRVFCNYSQRPRSVGISKWTDRLHGGSSQGPCHLQNMAHSGLRAWFAAERRTWYRALQAPFDFGSRNSKTFSYTWRSEPKKSARRRNWVSLGGRSWRPPTRDDRWLSEDRTGV